MDVQSPSTWLNFFVIAATPKSVGLAVCHIHSPSTPANPPLIQLAACAARHGTLARVAGVQGKIHWLWKALYSDPAGWTWWQVFCTPPRSPLSNLYFQGWHKPAGCSTAASCCRLGVHLVIPFYFSFFKTHQKDNKMAGRYWFVSLTNLPSCFKARIRVAKCKEKLQSMWEGGVQPQVERRLPGSRSLTHSFTLPTTQITRFCSRNACNGEVCSDLPRQSQQFPLTGAAVQANRPSSNLSPRGTAPKTTANKHWQRASNVHWLPVQRFPGNTAIEG